MPTEEEISKIIALHEGGKSQREIAKEFDKSVGWVNGVLKKLNIQSERSQTKRATEALTDYNTAKQIELGNKFFNRIDELMTDDISASDFRALAVTYGIIVDKRALLDGRPTGSLDVNVSGKSIDERLTELAARRAERQRAADP